MKVLTAITLRGSHKLLRMGSIRSPAALPWTAIRGRAFLSEQADDNRFCYYKGGVAAWFETARSAPPHHEAGRGLAIYALAPIRCTNFANAASCALTASLVG